MSLNIEKINDYTYKFLDREKHIITVQLPSDHTAEFNYNLALKAAEKISEANKPSSTQRYRLGHKNWKIQKALKTSRFMVFLSKILDFFHPIGDDGITRYKVTPSFFRPKKSAKESLSEEVKEEKALLKQVFKNHEERTNFKYFIRTTGAEVNDETIENYKNKIRGIVPLTEKVLGFEDPYFNDPFTNLAELAFQKFEKEFTSKDFFEPYSCDYRIVKNGDELHLVHHSAPIEKKDAKATVQFYKEFLIRNFGEEKIAYIEHLYRFKLDEISSLTPEHIYRINVGLTNLEYQDIDSLLAKLRTLKEDLQEVELLDAPLKKFLKAYPGLTGREAKGLFKYIESLQTDSTIGDLQEWLNILLPVPLEGEDDDPVKSTELGPKAFNKVLSIIHFSEEEKFKALTGRKIFGFIKSGYTNAGLNEYKPWVDQHQLTQFYPELINNSSHISYQEKLAHVVSKIHLAKEHPTEGYRVGSLIPAPPKKPGKPLRWYKVTSCVSNSYGIFSFTLESACDDPTLPSIKLYRSTASSRYAMHSQSTVVNDLNNFNSPGHQGIGRTDKYEEAFFKNHTIPIWVGYNLQAQEHLDSGNIEKAAESLHNAKEALREEFDKTHRLKSLKEIIRENDFLLNDLERDLHPLSFLLAIVGWTKVYRRWDYAKLFQQIIKSYILKTKIKHKSKINERKDAKRMVKVLKNIYKLERSECTKLKIEALISQIEQHILTTEAIAERNKARKEFEDEIYAHVEDLNAEVVKEPSEENIAALISALNYHAEERGEDLDSKRDGGLIFCGHSLGGACAQSHMVHWLAGKGRMPIPGTRLDGYDFDAPAINRKSNREFQTWGKFHRDLFAYFGIKIGIHKRQEAGDIVVTAGEMPLGAVSSEEEEKEIFYEYDTAVLKRNHNSKHFPIGLVLTAHETRFLEGQRLRTFYRREDLIKLRDEQAIVVNEERIELTKEELDYVDSLLEKNDYSCTYISPFVQGIFHSQGYFKHCSKEENKEYRKKFYALKSRLWNLQNFWGPSTAEEVRKGVSLFGMVIRKFLVRGDDNYRIDGNHIDEMGNFAVGEEGVLSANR